MPPRDQLPLPEAPGENLAQTVERLTHNPLQAATIAPTSHGQVPLMLVPDGMSLEVFKDLQLHPVRTTGVLHVRSLVSFRAVLERFMSDKHTVIFHGDSEAPFLRAVFDYSAREVPMWGEHAVHFDFRPTPEWAAWKAGDGQFLAQADFAEFIDDYAGNLVTHGKVDALAMVEAARAFKATRTLEFESEKRDHDGTLHLVYAEKSQASTRRSNVQIPEEFGVQVVPYYGCDPTTFTARFRYRVSPQGGLTMGYRFVRPEQVLEPIINAAIVSFTSYGVPVVHTGKTDIG